MARSKRQDKTKRLIAPLRVKVKFLEDCDPGHGKPIFKKDSIRELVISSANHWVSRGKAVKYVEKSERVKSVKPKQARPVGRPKKKAVKVESVEPVVMETNGAEVVNEEISEEESVIEGKKTEDGESSGEMDDLMA